ncbi:MAG: selenide, water dikinase SelD [Cyanobium sp.]
MESSPWRHHLVLAGGGHTHVLLLRSWCMHPRFRPPATRITLVSRQSCLCYSGLVPSVVAGLIPPGACLLDLRRLCTLADVAFVQDQIIALDPVAQHLHLHDRPPLGFDRLSLDVGSITPAAPGEVPVKPLESLLAWIDGHPPQAPRVRGGGASAVEVALALRARGFHPELLLRGPGLHLGSPAANRRAERLLAEAAIPLHRNVGEEERADLSCIGGRAPQWLAEAGLPVEPATGRVLTEPTLQVLHHQGVFASGDCGLVASRPRPPSGVWAVRAAPVLAANLQRSLHNHALLPWRPQRRALQLIGDGGLRTGQPRALATWGDLALGPARWLWHWKRHLDQTFMDSFALLQPMAPRDPAPGAVAMACRGCAAKLPARSLQATLSRLAQLDGPTSEVPAPEDAPLLWELPGGERLLQSVDGFPALVADPWLNGRLTTLHACSDLWASGATVRSVQAVVTLPMAAPSLQEELLLHSLAGIRSVLDPLEARLLGGHTLEGRDGAGLSLTLTVNGLASLNCAWAKGPLRAGDALLLTRPLGTGVLFAAAMAGAAKPEWLDQALAVMQQSQAPLVELLAAHGCCACTDITGFGLFGHLGEMLACQSAGSPPAPVVVELDGSSIPAFAGAWALLAAGHASTLAPANSGALTALRGLVHLRAQGLQRSTLEALLIDPQTCGPLLAALPEGAASGAIEALHAAGFGEAAVIGRVRPAPGGRRG